MPLGIIQKTTAIPSAAAASATTHAEGAGPFTLRRVAGDPTAARQTTSALPNKGTGTGYVPVTKALSTAAAAAKKDHLSAEQEQKLPKWVLDERTDEHTKQQWWYKAIKQCASKNGEIDSWIDTLPGIDGAERVDEPLQPHRREKKQQQELLALAAAAALGRAEKQGQRQSQKRLQPKHLRLEITSKSLQAPAARLFLKSLPNSLVTISLRRCNLTSSVVSEMLFFSDILHVKQLCLAGNHLTSVPLFLDHLPELQILDLSSNLIEWGTEGSHPSRTNNNSVTSTDNGGYVSGNASKNASVIEAEEIEANTNVQPTNALLAKDGDAEDDNQALALPDGHKVQATTGGKRNPKYALEASLSSTSLGLDPLSARPGDGGVEGTADDLLHSLGLLNARNPRLVYLNLEGNTKLNSGEHGEVLHSGYRDAVLSVMPNLLALDRHLISDEERVDNSIAFKKVLGLQSHDFLRFKAPFCAGHRSLRIPALFYEEQKGDLYGHHSQKTWREKASPQQKLAVQHKAEQLARSKSYTTTGEHMLVASPTGSPSGSPGKELPEKGGVGDGDGGNDNRSDSESMTGAYSTATLGTQELHLDSGQASAADLAAAQRQKMSAKNILLEQREAEEEDEEEAAEGGTGGQQRMSVQVLSRACTAAAGTAAVGSARLATAPSSSAAPSVKQAEIPKSVFNSQPTSQKLLSHVSSVKSSVGELFHMRYRLDGLVSVLTSQHRHTSPASIIQLHFRRYMDRKRTTAWVTKQPLTRLQAHIRRWLLFAKCRAEFKRALMEAGEWEEPPTAEELFEEKRKRELAVLLARTNHLSTFAVIIVKFFTKVTRKTKRYKAARKLQNWIRMLQNKWMQELHWLHRTICVFQQYKNTTQTPLSLLCIRQDLPYITGMLKTIAITHYRGHKNDAGVTVNKPEHASEEEENAKGNEPNWESSWEPEVQEVPFLKRIPFKWVQRTLTSRPPSPRLAPSASLIKLFASTARYPKDIVDIGTFQSVPKGNCGGLPFRLVTKLSGLWRLCNAFVPEKKPAAMSFGSLAAATAPSAAKKAVSVVGTMEWMRRAMRIINRRGVWIFGNEPHPRAASAGGDNTKSSKRSVKMGKIPSDKDRDESIVAATARAKEAAAHVVQQQKYSQTGGQVSGRRGKDDLVLIVIPMQMHVYRAAEGPITPPAPVTAAFYVPRTDEERRKTMTKVRSKAEFFAAHRPSDAAHQSQQIAEAATVAAAPAAEAAAVEGVVKIKGLFEAATAPSLAGVGVRGTTRNGFNLSIDSPGVHIMCRMLGQLRKATGTDTGTGLATTGNTRTWFFWDARRSAAAITIQCMWRGVYKRRVRSAQWLTKIIRKRAVICMQRWWRIRHYLHRRLNMLAQLTAMCRQITKPVLYMDMWAFYKSIKAPTPPHVPLSLVRAFPELRGVPHVNRAGQAVFKPVRTAAVAAMVPLATPPSSPKLILNPLSVPAQPKTPIPVPTLALLGMGEATSEEEKHPAPSFSAPAAGIASIGGALTAPTSALGSSARSSNSSAGSVGSSVRGSSRSPERVREKSSSSPSTPVRMLSVKILSPAKEVDAEPEEKHDNTTSDDAQKALAASLKDFSNADGPQAKKTVTNNTGSRVRVGFPRWAPFRPSSEAFFANKLSDSLHINKRAYEDEYAFATARQETYDHRTGEKLPLGGTYRLFTLLTQGITVRTRSLVLQKATEFPGKDIQPGNIVKKGEDIAGKFVDAKTDQEADVHVAELHFATVQEARARCALLWITTYCASTHTGLRMMTEEALWAALKTQCQAFKTKLAAGSSARAASGSGSSNSGATPAAGVANSKNAAASNASGKAPSVVVPVEATVFLQSPLPLWCGVGANITQLNNSFAYAATTPGTATHKATVFKKAAADSASIPGYGINDLGSAPADEWEVARFRFLMTSLVVHSVGSYMNANVNSNANANSIALAGQHANMRGRGRSESPTGEIVRDFDRLHARSPSPGGGVAGGPPTPSRPVHSPPTQMHSQNHRIATKPSSSGNKEKRRSEGGGDEVHNPYNLPYLQYSDSSGLGRGSMSTESYPESYDGMGAYGMGAHGTGGALHYRNEQRHAVESNYNYKIFYRKEDAIDSSSSSNSARSLESSLRGSDRDGDCGGPQYWVDVDGTTRHLRDYLVDFDYSHLLSTSLAEMESHASNDASAPPHSSIDDSVATTGGNDTDNDMIQLLKGNYNSGAEEKVDSGPSHTPASFRPSRLMKQACAHTNTQDVSAPPIDDMSARMTASASLPDSPLLSPREVRGESITTMVEGKELAVMSEVGAGSASKATVPKTAVNTQKQQLSRQEQSQDDGFESSRSHIPLSPSQAKLRAPSPAAELLVPLPGIGVIVPRNVKNMYPEALSVPAAQASTHPSDKQGHRYVLGHGHTLGLPADNTTLLPYHTSRAQAFVTASTPSVRWKTEATAAFLHDKNWTIERLLLWVSRGPEVSMLPFQQAAHMLRAPQEASIITDRAKAFTMAAHAALTARIETLQLGLYEHAVRQSRYSATDHMKTLQSMQSMQRDAKRQANTHALDGKTGIYQQNLIAPSRKEMKIHHSGSSNSKKGQTALPSGTAPLASATSIAVDVSAGTGATGVTWGAITEHSNVISNGLAYTEQSSGLAYTEQSSGLAYTEQSSALGAYTERSSALGAYTEQSSALGLYTAQEMLPSATGTRMLLNEHRPATSAPFSAHVIAPDLCIQIGTSTAAGAVEHLQEHSQEYLHVGRCRGSPTPALDSPRGDAERATATTVTTTAALSGTADTTQNIVIPTSQTQSQPSSRPTTSGSMPIASSGSNPISSARQSAYSALNSLQVSSANANAKSKSQPSVKVKVPLKPADATAGTGGVGSVPSKFTKKPIGGGSGLNAVVALHLRKTKEEEIVQIQKYREAEKRARVQALHAQAQASSESHLHMTTKGEKGPIGVNLTGAGAGAGTIARPITAPILPGPVPASPVTLGMPPQQPQHIEMSHIASLTRTRTKKNAVDAVLQLPTNSPRRGVSPRNASASATAANVANAGGNKGLAKIGNIHGKEIGHDLQPYLSPRSAAHPDIPSYSNTTNTILDNYISGPYAADRMGNDVRRTNPNPRTASANTRSRKGSPPRLSSPASPAAAAAVAGALALSVPSQFIAACKTELPAMNDDLSMGASATSVTFAGNGNKDTNLSKNGSRQGSVSGKNGSRPASAASAVGGGNINELELEGLVGPGSQYDIEEMQTYHHTSLALLTDELGDEDDYREELIALLEYSGAVGGGMGSGHLTTLQDQFDEENASTEDVAQKQRMWHSGKAISKRMKKDALAEAESQEEEKLAVGETDGAGYETNLLSGMSGTFGEVENGNAYDEDGQDKQEVEGQQEKEEKEESESKAEAEPYMYVDHAADVMSDDEDVRFAAAGDATSDAEETVPTDSNAATLYHLRCLSQQHSRNRLNRIGSTTSSEKLLFSGALSAADSAAGSPDGSAGVVLTQELYEN